MKKMTALLLALMLLWSGVAVAETNPLDEAYRYAAMMMVAGDYAGAAEAFAALVGYGDAPQMAIYCRGLAFASAGDYDTAVAAFEALGDFKDSAVQAKWFTGVGELAKAEAAIAGGRMMELERAETHLAAAETAFAALPYLPDAPAKLAQVRACREQVDAALPALRQAHVFDEVGQGFGECFAVKRDGKWGVLHVSGGLVVPCVYDSISWAGDGVAAVYQGELDKWGYPAGAGYGLVDFSGNVILPCEYVHVSLQYGLIWAYTADGVGTYFNADGTPCAPVDGRLCDQLAVDRYIEADMNAGTLRMTDGAGRVI